MSPIATLISTTLFIVIFLIVPIYIRHHKKSLPSDEHTYWFTNVDELL